LLIILVLLIFIQTFDFLLKSENARVPGTLNYRAGLPETRPLPAGLLWDLKSRTRHSTTLMIRLLKTI